MKKNIRRIRLLNQVMSVSLSDQEAETDFLFSEEDRDKLGAVTKGNYPLTISQLTTWAPIPNEMKQNYITKMLSLSNHLLKDRNIYVMMLMILLFEDKSDPYVSNINVQYWTMLKRYLETKTEILDINMAIGELENFKMSLIKWTNKWINMILYKVFQVYIFHFSFLEKKIWELREEDTRLCFSKYIMIILMFPKRYWVLAGQHLTCWDH